MRICNNGHSFILFYFIFFVLFCFVLFLFCFVLFCFILFYFISLFLFFLFIYLFSFLFVVHPVACQKPLGIESGNVTSDQLTASSFQKKVFQAANATLNQEGAWVPATNDQNQWFQVDLHRQILVSGIVIQGRSDIKEWVY